MQVSRGSPPPFMHGRPGRAPELSVSPGRPQRDRATWRHRPHRGAAALDTARRRRGPGSYRTLRYLANTGGRCRRTRSMHFAPVRPRPGLPDVRPHRSLQGDLPGPSQLDLRPDSISKAISNSEILVLRKETAPCEPDEPGSSCSGSRSCPWATGTPGQDGRTRFPACLPLQPGGQPSCRCGDGRLLGRYRAHGRAGYLYFIGRDDDMIKTSGYRVSPTEIEEIVLSTNLVLEMRGLWNPGPGTGRNHCSRGTCREGGQSTKDD